MDNQQSRHQHGPKKQKKKHNNNNSNLDRNIAEMDAYINSSRAGHGAPNLLEAREGGPEEDSRRSSILSNDARGDLPYNQSEP